MMEKQVDKTHYEFSKYVTNKRWTSIYHQLSEVLSVRPGSVLEIGPGPGIFKILLKNYGVSVDTVDIDADLNPDFVASADDLPFSENSYDCVCAFQVLEHLPYAKALMAFSEMARVSKKYVMISLPNAKIISTYSFYIPKHGQFNLHIPNPCLRLRAHKFNGQHYWEINKKGYLLKKVIDDFSQKGVKAIKNYLIPDNPCNGRSCHQLIIFEKIKK